MNKEKKLSLVDDYIASSPEFARPICQKLRELIFEAEPHIKEVWKWGPSYELNGLVCGFGAFKKHVHFTFYNGALMKDSAGLFTEGLNNRRNRGIKFRTAIEINEKLIVSYLKESVRLNKQGMKAPDKEIEIPEDFKKLLSREKLLENFESMAYTHRKEYINWIVEAKKEETRERRLQKAVQMIKEGEKYS